MTEITDKALRVLFHTLGLRPEQGKMRQYRNHYVAGPGHHSEAALDELEALGLVKRVKTPGFIPPDSVVYQATADGERVARCEALRHAR